MKNLGLRLWRWLNGEDGEKLRAASDDLARTNRQLEILIRAMANSPNARLREATRRVLQEG